MMPTPEPTPPFGHPSSEGIGSTYFIGYEPHLKALARELRQNMTLGEVILWRHLQGKRMCGYDFDRQRPIDRYIVDFYCKRLRLAIEVDGSSHDGEVAKQNDFVRQSRLESLGVCFLRFSETQVRSQTKTVVQTIEIWITQHAS
jgi:very-short-patch-repair endonuclease